jgi:hypothetical protein
VLASVASLALAACGTSAASRETTGIGASAIIDGDASTPLQNFVVQVVHPVGDDAELVCSGSLVAPTLVLTARHCVSATSGDGFTCDESGDGSDGGALGADYDPPTVLIYAGLYAPGALATPSAKGVRFFHDSSTNVCNHDLALIELDQPLDYPIAGLDLDSKLATGQTITAVGWGVVADGGTPGVRQELGGVSILAVGPASEALYDVPPNEFAVGQSICEGDSGGPALDAKNAVVGVVSSGGNNVNSASANPAVTCLGPETVNLYTATAAFRDVILAAFATVGAAPVLVSVPMGETCTASSECTSGLCATVDADAGTVCTQSCATASCPDGFRCDTTGGESLCASAPSSGCAVAPRDDGWGAPFTIGMALAMFAVRRRRGQFRPGP